MPDTKGYPRTKEGRNAYMKKCYETVHKENPKLSQKAIVGKCEGLFDSKWNAKKKINASITEDQFWAEFSWETCAECIEIENKLNKKMGIFEIDIAGNITG